MRQPRLPQLGLGAAGELGQPPVGEAQALGLPERVAREVGRLPERLLERNQLLDLGEEPGIDPREPGDLLAPEPPPDRLGEIEEAVGVGDPQAVAEGLEIRRRTGRGPRPVRSCSSERMAFWSASLKVRPMAITSPTDFIWVVSVWSASGNFSNAQRGIFTTQ